MTAKKHSNLDILTPKGRKTREQEKEMYRFLRKALGVRFKETPKDQPVSHDSYMYKDGKLVAICEAKCRQMTEKELERYGGTWLVSEQKIVDCREVAKAKGVPFIGLLYLVPDRVVYMLKIADKNGKLKVKYTPRKTLTQTTVNNRNKIERLNAYLPLNKAIRLRMDD